METRPVQSKVGDVGAPSPIGSRRMTAPSLILAALAVVVAISVLAEHGSPVVAAGFAAVGAGGLLAARRLWRRP